MSEHTLIAGFTYCSVYPNHDEFSSWPTEVGYADIGTKSLGNRKAPPSRESWNELGDETVSVGTIKAFKTKLGHMGY